MNKKFESIIFLSIAILIGACKEKYAPLAVTTDHNYLVVEGFINTSGRTNIRLSRTVKLTDPKIILTELKAIIFAEGDNNSTYLLTEEGNGNYFSDQIFFPNTARCRLRIRTISGKEYLSDFIPVKETPPIDSISWERKDGVHIYANTHDPANNARNYRWEYQEDWEFHSSFDSYIEFVNGMIVPRDPNVNIYRCWKSEKSTRIIIASSGKLSSDVLKLIPITQIPEASRKLIVRYSVLVRQFALTKEGFEYWQQIKRNSEQLGTILDPMPSQTVGNIHCLTSPEEPVIGFISAGTVAEKRIFITREQVMPWLIFPPVCLERLVPRDSVEYFFRNYNLIPLTESLRPPGINMAEARCVDCRLEGTNIKPPFWP